MNDRRCGYCQQLFQPSRFRFQQLVCSRSDCQRQRRRDYHRRKVETDSEYAQVVRDSRSKWREAHPNYQKNSARKIARHLHLSRKTLRKYIHSPVQTPARRHRTSKIDPFKSTVAGLLEQDPTASAVVILQRLRPLGYEGGITVLRNYVSQLRGLVHPPRAFVRMEPAPAERFEVDWGHFGTLDYAGDKRNLYAFCLVEGHSRMLYVEFTHSQSFETFVRCHLHAFEALHGVAREGWYDFVPGNKIGLLFRSPFCALTTGEAAPVLVAMLFEGNIMNRVESMMDSVSNFRNGGCHAGELFRQVVNDRSHPRQLAGSADRALRGVDAQGRLR